MEGVTGDRQLCTQQETGAGAPTTTYPHRGPRDPAAPFLFSPLDSIEELSHGTRGR
jgi:hypothetical protein